MNKKSPSHRNLKRGAITIPKELRERLELEDDDIVTIVEEDGRIIIEPARVIPASQAWFWTENWQNEEREINKEYKREIINDSTT